MFTPLSRLHARKQQKQALRTSKYKKTRDAGRQHAKARVWERGCEREREKMEKVMERERER